MKACGVQINGALAEERAVKQEPVERTRACEKRVTARRVRAVASLLEEYRSSRHRSLLVASVAKCANVFAVAARAARARACTVACVCVQKACGVVYVWGWGGA